MKAINLNPKAVELLNTLCDEEELDCRISLLEEAEGQLQETAYQTSHGSDQKKANMLYDTAYTLKMYKNELIELKKELKDGREKENDRADEE